MSFYLHDWLCCIHFLTLLKRKTSQIPCCSLNVIVKPVIMSYWGLYHPVPSPPLHSSIPCPARTSDGLYPWVQAAGGSLLRRSLPSQACSPFISIFIYLVVNSTNCEKPSRWTATNTVSWLTVQKQNTSKDKHYKWDTESSSEKESSHYWRHTVWKKTYFENNSLETQHTPLL